MNYLTCSSVKPAAPLSSPSADGTCVCPFLHLPAAPPQPRNMKLRFRHSAALILTGAAAFFAVTAAELENFEQNGAERAALRRAEQMLDEHAYSEAAEIFGDLADTRRSPARTTAFRHRQAQSLLLAKKAHKARKIYLDLVNRHLFYLPVSDIAEELRELANLFWRGEGTFLGLSDPEAAIDLCRLIIKIQPAINLSIDDRLLLTDWLADRGRYEEAVQNSQEAIKLAPANPDLRLQLGKLLVILAKKSDGDGQRIRAAMREAGSFLELADASDPRRPQAREILTTGQQLCAARLLEKATFYMNKYHYRPAVARRYLHDLLRDYPDTAEARTAGELLTILPEEGQKP